MDRSVEVRTPESIAFNYQLAGLGSRFLAVVTDLFVQDLVAIAILFGLVYLAGHGPHGARTPPRVVTNIAVALILFVFFMIFFGYFVFFEAFWNGQTPGKKLLGIRVVRDGGYPVDFSAALIRNLIRIAEAALGFYVISAISALISSENKRIGDFAAGTIVVRDARIASPSGAGAALAQATPDYAATSILRGEERELLHRFIERRDALPASRRAELAAQLAARIRPRVSADLARLDDESLLERL